MTFMYQSMDLLNRLVHELRSGGRVIRILEPNGSGKNDEDGQCRLQPPISIVPLILVGSAKVSLPLVESDYLYIVGISKNKNNKVCQSGIGAHASNSAHVL